MLGSPYGFNGKVDGPAIAEVLRLCSGDLDEAERRWRRALQLALAERYPGTQQLAQLPRAWNALAAPVPPGASRGATQAQPADDSCEACGEKTTGRVWGRVICTSCWGDCTRVHPKADGAALNEWLTRRRRERRDVPDVRTGSVRAEDCKHPDRPCHIDPVTFEPMETPPRTCSDNSATRLMYPASASFMCPSSLRVANEANAHRGPLQALQVRVHLRPRGAH